MEGDNITETIAIGVVVFLTAALVFIVVKQVNIGNYFMTSTLRGMNTEAVYNRGRVGVYDGEVLTSPMVCKVVNTSQVKSVSIKNGTEVKDIKDDGIDYTKLTQFLKYLTDDGKYQGKWNVTVLSDEASTLPIVVLEKEK